MNDPAEYEMMSKKIKAPAAGSAWAISLAAILDLIAFGFLAAAGSGLSTLGLFGAATAVLILYSIGAWKQYFERYTEYQVQREAGCS